MRMENKPLVSVLMAIYNCSDTLEQAVNCIINQTYDNWELILYDDCSEDDTYKKALALSKQYSRIRVYKNEKNLTLAPTLNNCLAVSNGLYTARMDGDDTCALDRFEKEVSFLNSHPEYALVSCQMSLFDNEGVYREIKYLEKPQARDFIYSSQICHAGCMMRKSVLEQLNGYNTSKDVVRVEDYDLWVRLYEAGFKAYNIQEVLYNMRDDRNANKRRKFKYRINEYKIKKKVKENCNLSFKYSFQVIKPIAVGLLPSFVFKKLHRI